MVKTIQVSVPSIIIIIAVIILLILFWIYLRNTRRITSTLDKKTTLAQVVNAISHVLVHVPGISTNTPAGIKLDLSQTHALGELFQSFEHSVIKMDGSANSDTYVFIYDTSGNKILDSQSAISANAHANSTFGMRLIRPLVELKVKDVPVDTIIQKAADGGGFVEFQAKNPKTNKLAKKIAYVKLIPRTHWILGSAMYV